MKILIVDDSVMDRKLTINALKKSGINNEILEAVDGEQGLKTLSENVQDVSVIILDWQMPNIDGIEFMKGVISVPATAKIPIIMVTASGSDENKKYARDVNPDLAGYVVKPYKAQKLAELVKEHLPEG